MQHYRIESAGRRNQWQVVHTASGMLATTCGILATVTQDQACRWAGIAERFAPTHDPQQAAQALIAVRYPARYRRWMLKRHGAI